MKVKSLKKRDEDLGNGIVRAEVGHFHRVHKPKRRQGSGKYYRKTHAYYRKKIEKLKIKELVNG